MPEASPVLPTPVGPMNTMFSALAMKSSSAKARIWRWLTPGCCLKGKLSRRPGLGEVGLADPVGQGRLLAVVPLGAQQPGQELLVGGLCLGRLGQFLVQVSAIQPQVQVREQLLEIILHGDPPRIRWHRLR